MPRIVTLLTLLLLAVGFNPVAAQTAWPTKPVKFFVAGAPGSAPDIVGRLIAAKLAETWGQPTIIDNRAGGAGNLGTQAAVLAGPDGGHNLLFGQAAPMAMNQYLFKEMPFDVEKDFLPIVSLGISPMMIAVNADVPAKTLPELIALAKAQPGKLSFGTSSSKNIPHLTGEMLANMAGIKLLHVPYRAGTQAAQETISGLTQIYVDGVPPMSGHRASGRLRVLAVSSARRLPNFPDIPAVAETLPGFEMNGWFAVMAMVGTPPGVIARVNRDINAVVKDKDIAERLLGFGMYEPGGTPEQLAAFLASERKNYAKAVGVAGITPE